MPVPALSGVNLFDDPRAIRDDEVQLSRNLAPARPGILKKRGGLDRPFVQVNNIATTDRPHAAVMSPVPDSESEIVFTFSTSSGSGTTVVGVTLAGGIPASQSMPFKHPRVPMVPWKNAIYMLPGPHAEWAPGPSMFPFYVFDVNTEGAAALTTLPFTNSTTSPAGNNNVFPKYAFPYKQRLVLANFGKGYENTILFTNDFRPDQVGPDALASNGRSISLVAGADGDEIVAGIEVMLTNVGSPAESGLLILRRYGDPFLLTGDMTQVSDEGTASGDFTLDIKRISVKTGCAGQYTVVRTPVGIVWAGADDVWCFAAGVLPHRLGQKIQPALKLTPAQLQYRWSAAYFDGFYRLAVWGAGQPMTLTDAPGDQWWLDLRDGLPEDWREAKWWGPQQFLGGAVSGAAPVPQTWALVAESRAGKDAALFYVDRVEVASGDYGTVLGTYGTGPRDMTAVAAYIADSDYVDPEVTAELVTKEYALSPGRDQINDGVMMVLRPSNDLTINADFVIDDGDQVLTRTKRIAGPDNFRLDSSLLDQTDGSSRVTGRATKTALYPTTRRAGQTHRFRIYDTAGHTVVTGFNDTLLVAVGDFHSNPPQYRLTAPAGSYTISTLLTALNAALLTDADGVTHGTLSANGILLSVVATLVTFDDSPSPSNSNLVISFVSNASVSSLFAVAADWEKSRRLGAILGFDTNSNPSFFGDGGGGPFSFSASTVPFKKGVADWEIYGIAANMEVLPRTP